jgi:hypothetical protein
MLDPMTAMWAEVRNRLSQEDNLRGRAGLGGDFAPDEVIAQLPSVATLIAQPIPTSGPSTPTGRIQSNCPPSPCLLDERPRPVPGEGV